MHLSVIGNISIDTVAYGTRVCKPFYGGAGLNVAIAAARAGCRPRLISVVGKQSNDLLTRVSPYIDTEYVSIRDGQTCQFGIEYNEDGTLLNLNCDFGVSYELTNFLETIPLNEGFYHVCCRNPINPISIIERLQSNSLPFSLDFIASSVSEQAEYCRHSFGYADIVFVNRQEKIILDTIPESTEIKLLIVTAASEPVSIFQRGEQIMEVQCPVHQRSEVTGAGDVFAGTFLANYLARRSAHASVVHAIAAAQQSLEEDGVCSDLTAEFIDVAN